MHSRNAIAATLWARAPVIEPLFSMSRQGGDSRARFSDRLAMAVPEAQAATFLRELEATKSVSEAARRAGFRARQPLYTLRDRDHAFRAAWDKAVGREPPPAPPSPRIPVELMTPEQRRLARAFLDALVADPLG